MLSVEAHEAQPWPQAHDWETRAGEAVAAALALTPFAGLADAAPWTSREATAVQEVPASLAILGGGVVAAEMATAYRMSAEIAAWLNDHAAAHGIDAVELLGIRPTGVEVAEVAGDRTTAEARRTDLDGSWANVALITAEDTWSHKGVEYDAVVVDTTVMDAAQIYLAASRAAHQLVIIHPG